MEKDLGLGVGTRSGGALPGSLGYRNVAWCTPKRWYNVKTQDKMIENSEERAVENAISETVKFLPFVNCFAEMLYELRLYK